MLEFMEPICAVRDSPQTVWAARMWFKQLIHDCGVYKAMNGHGIRVHKVEPRLGSCREQ